MKAQESGMAVGGVLQLVFLDMVDSLVGRDRAQGKDQD